MRYVAVVLYPSKRFLREWYTAYAVCEDAWTPGLIMSINLNDDITIKDSIFSDWRI